jgi:Tfp pilus assembly protein PilV
MQQRRPGAHRGQALVETAIALPIIMLIAFGVLGVARLNNTLMAVTATAREAARAAVLAPTAEAAWDWGTSRGQQVAAEYGLDTSSQAFLLDVDVSSFEWWGEVRTSASYIVTLADIPLIGWAAISIPLHRSHAEVLDPYRSSP